MEPPESSPPHPLPEAGEGKEEVKEANELKLGVDKDTATETSDVESPMAAQRRLTEGEGELEVEEHQEGDRMATESLFEQESDCENKYYAKEHMKEANEEKLDAARDGAKTLNVESSTVGHGRVTKVEGEKEENQDTRMAEAPGETNLVEDYGKEQVMKEADEEKLESAKDSANKTLDAESSTVDQTRLNKDKGEIEQHHKPPGMARESDLRETDPVENYGKGKEQMKETDEEELDAPKERDETNAESSMAAQRNLTKEGGEIEEHHVYARMPSESQETDSAKGKEKVIEANMVQIIIARDKGKGKEKINEANVVQKIIVRDNEHPETPETTRESLPENRHDQDDGKGTEKVNEAIVVQIIIIRDNEAQTLDAPPYAESSIAAEKRLAKGEGEIQEGDRTTPESPNQDLNPILYYAYDLVKNVKEKCFIHRVHSGLRDGSDKHYEPVLVSIGPYHHGEPPVRDMETYKIHYMEVLLQREKDKFERYMEALEDRQKQPRALDCYRDTHKMDKDSFAKSMVYDGCFMIELFRRKMKPDKYEDLCNDIPFNIRWMKSRLERDMLLFENQIPLLVLRALFSLTDKEAEERDFVPLVLKFFEFNGITIPYDASLTNRLYDIPHLLGLVYKALVSREKEKDSVPGPPGKLNGMWTSLKSFIWTVFVRLIEKTFRLKPAQQLNNERKSCEFIRTAVALEQVGVTFVRVEDNFTFHDIKFSSGVLSIPRLVINDNTESFFRNLVAYEQYSEKNSLHRVVDYLHVMDCLINTSKDVVVLRHCGIIDNRIGDDAKVSTMFNCLCSDVYFNQDEFFYKRMFDDVNKFCMDRTNAWKATLKNEYFGSPWSVISFIAAVLLLLFTATQTVYSVLSYYHSSS